MINPNRLHWPIKNIMEQLAIIFFFIGGILIGGAVLLFCERKRLRTYLSCIAGFIGLTAATTTLLFYLAGEHRDWINIISNGMAAGGGLVLAKIVKDSLKARRES